MATADIPPSADDDPDTQAIEWVVRLTSGETGLEEQRQFEAWRHASPLHEAALDRARRLWLQLESPLMDSHVSHPADEEPVVPSFALPPQTRSVRTRWLSALAAVAVLILGVVQWQGTWRYTHVNGSGSPQAHVLADGSTLWLDAESAVNVDMGADRRHVQLVRGAAFFDVVRDSAHPFTVDAGRGQVRVLGTAFGVQRGSDDVLVTVQRGRVAVSGGEAAPVELIANQQVMVRPGDHARSVLSVDAERTLAWHRGLLMFQDQSLTAIVQALKRYDSRLVLLTYPGADRLRLDAMIKLDQMDDWYDGLEQSLPVRVSRLGPLVWIR